MQKGTCSVDGCEKPLFCKGMCRACYSKARYNPVKRVRKGERACECGSKVVARGKCMTCYRREIRADHATGVYEDKRTLDTRMPQDLKLKRLVNRRQKLMEELTRVDSRIAELV